MPHLSSKLTLESAQSECFSNYHLRILDKSNPVHTELFRQHVRAQMANSFQGWNDNFDRQFDHHSTLTVALNDAGEILATCKFVYRYVKGVPFSTPLSFSTEAFNISDCANQFPLAHKQAQLN